MAYKIVKADSLEELTELVQAHLDRCWQLVGGVAVIDRTYIQAMSHPAEGATVNTPAGSPEVKANVQGGGHGQQVQE
jgi:hypothetical protein